MEFLKLRVNNFRHVLDEATGALKRGQVLICPTDTVYGMVGHFANQKAMQRMCAIKKRPPHKLFPVFIKDIKMAAELADINAEQKKFLKAIWPGKVTCILPLKNGRGTIGLRLPKHKFALALVERVGPLAQTSANISGQPASTKIKEVLAQFKGRKYQPDLVIDADNLTPSKPSKVIDLTVIPFKILRQ